MGRVIYAMKEEFIKKRIGNIKKATEEAMADVDNLHVYISTGNRKTGLLVPSVSLRPVLDCVNCSKCRSMCYDLRNDCMYKNVIKTRAINYAILKDNPDKYFFEISGACRMFTAFRWHIGGDIINEDYLRGMIKVAKENNHCQFIAFTKAFDIVNGYLDNGGVIPDNLRIIFSGWVGLDMKNPYNLPTAHPIFPDGTTSANDGAKLCTGNCSECLIQKRNCWTLKEGEQIVFVAH